MRASVAGVGNDSPHIRAPRRAMATLRLIARGVGGVDEMREALDDGAVSFGVARLRLGRGTFARYKSVFVHWSAPNAPVVRRGRANAMRGVVEARMSPCAMGVTLEAREECATDAVVEALARVCAKDEGEGDSPRDFEERVATMRADVREQLAEAKRAFEETLANRSGTKLRRLTLREMSRRMTFREVAEAVRKSDGAFNWYLVRADANGSEVFNAGGGSLEEMKASLPSNEVLFGLLRMGFGRGAFRRVKHIFIHWSGEDVNALKRGQYNAQEEAIRKLVGSVNVNHFATSMDEITLDALIEKVKTRVVLDGEASDDVDSLFNLESYMVSCEDDDDALRREFPEAIVQANGNDEKDERQPTFEEALESVNSKSEPYNWLLCELVL